MTDAYVLSEADVRTLRRMAQRERGDPINHRPPVSSQSLRSRQPVVRLGVAYGTLPPATYDASGTLVTAGKGECKLHRLRGEDQSVIDQDDLPTRALSIMPYAVEDSKELLLLRDQTIEADDPHAQAAGYLALQWQSSEFKERCLFVCSGGGILADDDSDQKLYLGTVDNFDTDTYGVDADGHAIELKRVGLYEIRHDWKIDPTTTVSEGSERATVHLRSGTALPLTSIASCFTLQLGTYMSDSADHDLASAGCTWYIHRQDNGTGRWVDWMMRRVATTNSAVIDLVSARFRYLGDLGLPTVQAFTDPGTL